VKLATQKYCCFTVVLLAGGLGLRFSDGFLKESSESLKPKQFYEILPGIQIIDQSLKAFLGLPEAFLQKIIAVLPDEFIEDNDLKSRLRTLVKSFDVELDFVQGGNTRQDSCFRALGLVESEYLLVHDAARPLLDTRDLQKLLKAMPPFNGASRAAILAKPVTDTIKLVKQKNDLALIDQTLDRSQLWAAETPQAFETSLLKSAYEKALKDNFVGTDDASLVENLGETVQIVQSEFPNLKITNLQDLLLARALLQGTCS
jgi:2-C-methyl-D-erythritol 4-phosphate cytidylyltransferase